MFRSDDDSGGEPTSGIDRGRALMSQSTKETTKRDRQASEEQLVFVFGGYCNNSTRTHVVEDDSVA
jgi:hypothetical protein